MKPARPASRRWLAALLSGILAFAPLTTNSRPDASSPFKVSAAAAKDGHDGSDDSGGGDHSGRGGGQDDDDQKDDEDRRDDRRDDKERRSGPNGEMVERDDEQIKVLYPDGYREELADGVFKMEDPRGRTVIERRATANDRARLEALLR